MMRIVYGNAVNGKSPRMVYLRINAVELSVYVGGAEESVLA